LPGDVERLRHGTETKRLLLNFRNRLLERFLLFFERGLLLRRRRLLDGRAEFRERDLGGLEFLLHRRENGVPLFERRFLSGLLDFGELLLYLRARRRHVLVHRIRPGREKFPLEVLRLRRREIPVDLRVEFGTEKLLPVGETAHGGDGKRRKREPPLFSVVGERGFEHEHGRPRLDVGDGLLELVSRPYRAEDLRKRLEGRRNLVAADEGEPVESLFHRHVVRPHVSGEELEKHRHAPRVRDTLVERLGEGIPVPGVILLGVVQEPHVVLLLHELKENPGGSPRLHEMPERLLEPCGPTRENHLHGESEDDETREDGVVGRLEVLSVSVGVVVSGADHERSRVRLDDVVHRIDDAAQKIVLNRLHDAGSVRVHLKDFVQKKHRRMDDRLHLRFVRRGIHLLRRRIENRNRLVGRRRLRRVLDSEPHEELLGERREDGVLPRARRSHEKRRLAVERLGLESPRRRVHRRSHSLHVRRPRPSFPFVVRSRRTDERPKRTAEFSVEYGPSQDVSRDSENGKRFPRGIPRLGVGELERCSVDLVAAFYLVDEVGNELVDDFYESGHVLWNLRSRRENLLKDDLLVPDMRPARRAVSEVHRIRVLQRDVERGHMFSRLRDDFGHLPVHVLDGNLFVLETFLAVVSGHHPRTDHDVSRSFDGRFSSVFDYSRKDVDSSVVVRDDFRPSRGDGRPVIFQRFERLVEREGGLPVMFLEPEELLSGNASAGGFDSRDDSPEKPSVRSARNKLRIRAREVFPGSDRVGYFKNSPRVGIRKKPRNLRKTRFSERENLFLRGLLLPKPRFDGSEFRHVLREIERGLKSRHLHLGYFILHPGDGFAPVDGVARLQTFKKTHVIPSVCIVSGVYPQERKNVPRISSGNVSTLVFFFCFFVSRRVDAQNLKNRDVRRLLHGIHHRHELLEKNPLLFLRTGFSSIESFEFPSSLRKDELRPPEERIRRVEGVRFFEKVVESLFEKNAELCHSGRGEIPESRVNFRKRGRYKWKFFRYILRKERLHGVHKDMPCRVLFRYEPKNACGRPGGEIRVERGLDERLRTARRLEPVDENFLLEIGDVAGPQKIRAPHSVEVAFGKTRYYSLPLSSVEKKGKLPRGAGIGTFHNGVDDGLKPPVLGSVPGGRGAALRIPLLRRR